MREMSRSILTLYLMGYGQFLVNQLGRRAFAV